MPDEISSKLDITYHRQASPQCYENPQTWLEDWITLDPLVHGKDWQLLYKDLIDQVFSYSLKVRTLVSFGALRFPKRMFKKIVNLIRMKFYFQIFQQPTELSVIAIKLKVK